MKTYPAPWYFYTEAVDGEYKNIYGKSLKRHDFNNWREFTTGVEDFKRMRKEIYESDIPAELKVLSQNYYEALPPDLHISVYDIEIDYDPSVDFQGAKNPVFPINSLSLLNIWENTNYVMAIPPNGERAEDIDANQFLSDMEEIEPLNYPTKVEFFNTERELLGRFLDLIEDADVISGWNSEMFDDPYTAKRIEKVLEHRLHALSFKGASKPRFSEKENFNEMEPIVRFSGRVNIDYLELYKKFSFGEEPSYKLESIAEKVLKDMRKLEFSGTLADLYKNDFTKFVRYNIRDTEILGGFERVLGFLNQANALYHNTTGLFHHSLKTLKNTELGMINYCHYVLDDLKVPDTHIPSHHSSIEGGYVIAPKRGQHDNLASVDMTALYPSSIRSNNISPETLIGQFDDKKKAFEAIHNRSDQVLNFQFEEKTTGSDQEVSMTAAEWRETLLDKGWGISGYGTVFNLKTKGILPGLLESWFIERKKTKALSIEFAKKSEAFEKDSPEYKELIAKSQYYDRIQQVMKLQLNSAYGSLCNKYFKFNDTRLGASTTATGQVLLKHQTAKVNELLTGKYDLEGDAIIYGDTDSSYFKTFAKDIETATKVGDAVGLKVNESFPEFMRDAFLCTDTCDKIIETDREIIGSSGIFMNKKMDIVHVVNDEGKKVDKVKAMGIALKKSTLPKEYQVQLSKFVEQILKKRDWNDVALDIVNYKESVLNSSILRIGLPIGVKNMVKYTDNWENIGYKTFLPGNVAASIHWNIAREVNNDNESIKITTGTKIKVYYLKTKYYNKFKSIAIPTDATEIPTWFTEDYLEDVDVDAQLLRLIDKPLLAILSAIGKDVPSKQQLSNNSLVE